MKAKKQLYSLLKWSVVTWQWISSGNFLKILRREGIQHTQFLTGTMNPIFEELVSFELTFSLKFNCLSISLLIRCYWLWIILIISSDGLFSTGSNVLSYVNMVCASLRNSIPKSVVYCQVREAKRSLLDHFFTELGKKEVRILHLTVQLTWKLHFLAWSKCFGWLGWGLFSCGRRKSNNDGDFDVYNNMCSTFQPFFL